MSEKELHNYMMVFLASNGYDDVLENKNEYIYALGSEIALIAHLDTVHAKKPTLAQLTLENQVLSGLGIGIGADDRNGIFTIMKMIESGFNPTVIITHDEECGGLGATALVNDFPSPIQPLKMLIEIDRRGIGEAVFYYCGNVDFIDLITSYGFHKEYGTFSDISNISPFWDVASVNLSAGYYNEHTSREKTIIGGLQYTIDALEMILNDEMFFTFYDFQEQYFYSRKSYSNYNLPSHTTPQPLTKTIKGFKTTFDDIYEEDNEENNEDDTGWVTELEKERLFKEKHFTNWVDFDFAVTNFTEATGVSYSLYITPNFFDLFETYLKENKKGAYSNEI